jgi:predicted DCC family thiol-disulfide oxidoreductase YuxK
MLYDGTCGVCRRTVDIVQRLDVLGRVDVLDAARDWPSVERRYPMLSQAACLEEMHVLRPDGRAERGFDAYRVLARALPVTWAIVPILYVPGVRWIGQAVYKSVAHGVCVTAARFPRLGPHGRPAIIADAVARCSSSRQSPVSPPGPVARCLPSTAR